MFDLMARPVAAYDDGIRVGGTGRPVICEGSMSLKGRFTSGLRRDLHRGGWCLRNGVRLLKLCGMGEQVDDKLCRHFLLAGFAFSDEECERHERVVIDLALSLFCEEVVVLREKQDEKKRADPFVAICKGMILDDKIEKVRSFLFNARIEI